IRPHLSAHLRARTVRSQPFPHHRPGRLPLWLLCGNSHSDEVDGKFVPSQVQIHGDRTRKIPTKRSPNNRIIWLSLSRCRF
ncbi:unnamed protein product, partial [Musa acuminata var. zebrina]